MSHRLKSGKSPWQRYAAVAAAVVVIGGGAAVATAAAGHSGGSGSRAGSTADAAGAPTGGVTSQPTAGVRAGGGTASPSATASGTAHPSGSPSATASPNSSASASPGASGHGGSSSSTSGGTSAQGPSHAAGPSHPASAKVYTGVVFDTCTAPSASKMSAWKSAGPYGGAAVYIGGANRGCSQPQLTASWVRTVSSAGWKLVPIYVGAQPPCQTSGNPERITSSNAASLGASDGADAVARAQALGMRSTSAIYLDMESYDTGDSSCVKSVLTYIQAWDRALHGRGYWAGFYGFTSSSASAVASAKSSTPDMPDALWYARYDGTNSTTTGFPFSSGLWTGHRRGHQYKVNSKETYGGVTITVDRDAWDAPVAVTG